MRASVRQHLYASLLHSSQDSKTASNSTNEAPSALSPKLPSPSKYLAIHDDSSIFFHIFHRRWGLWVLMASRLPFCQFRCLWNTQTHARQRYTMTVQRRGFGSSFGLSKWKPEQLIMAQAKFQSEYPEPFCVPTGSY